MSNACKVTIKVRVSTWQVFYYVCGAVQVLFRLNNDFNDIIAINTTNYICNTNIHIRNNDVDQKIRTLAQPANGRYMNRTKVKNRILHLKHDKPWSSLSLQQTILFSTGDMWLCHHTLKMGSTKCRYKCSNSIYACVHGQCITYHVIWQAQPAPNFPAWISCNTTR